MFKLAHLSDVHLAPMPKTTPGLLLTKRLIGTFSWNFHRKNIHDRKVLDMLVADIHNSAPDHIALTGDLTNMAQPAEFAAAVKWMAGLGGPKDVSFVPGNHDAYVKQDWSDGLAQLGDYMIGDLNTPGVRMSGNVAAIFPYVRKRRNIALIGVSTAIPVPWNKAWGEVGNRQLAALEKTLLQLKNQGFYRLVMIHHPPLPEQAHRARRLLDDEDLQIVLEKCGADLVLHGHNHRHMHKVLKTATGPAHIIGVPSASAHKTKHKPGATWYEFGIERREGHWRTTIASHHYNEETAAMETSPIADLNERGF